MSCKLKENFSLQKLYHITHSNYRYMPEYTLLTILSLIIVFILDWFLNTRLFFNKKFWLFQIIVVFFTTIVNGYLTGRPIVEYGEEFQLGIRIFTIPIEDYFFGFSLLTLFLIFIEWLEKKPKYK